MKLHPTGKFDNRAAEYDHIRVVPLASAMGAEIEGVDLAALNDAIFAEIEDALYRHKMIYFRDQELRFEDQESLTKRFGKFGTDAYTTGTPGHPDIQEVIKEADTVTPIVFGDGWHTDSPFLDRPPSISLLYGVDIPPYGGDTIWSNTQLAYNYLSETMKAVLAPLKVHMSAAGVMSVLEGFPNGAGAAKAPEGAPSKMGNIDLGVDKAAMIKGSFHPIVRTHPKSGARALYVEQTYSSGIEGMTDELLTKGRMSNFLAWRLPLILYGRGATYTGTWPTKPLLAGFSLRNRRNLPVLPDCAEHPVC